MHDFYVVQPQSDLMTIAVGSKPTAIFISSLREANTLDR